MKLKKCIAIMTVICLLLSICACRKTNKNNTDDTDSSQPSGGYTSSSVDDYENTTSDWTQGSSSVTENNSEENNFDNNSSGENSTPKPGDNGSGIIIKPTTENINQNNPENNESDNNGSEDKDNLGKTEDSDDNKPQKEPRNLPESNLTDKKDELQYYYEAKDYVYAITENTEYIAYRDSDGKLYDVINGGGKFAYTSSSDFKVGDVAGFEQEIVDGITKLMVTYELTGKAAEDSELTTVYTFNTNGISFAMDLKLGGENTITTSSKIKRTFVNSYAECTAAVHEKWVYPPTGDHPYPDFESFVVKHRIDDTLWLYSAVRGDCTTTKYSRPESYNSVDLPLKSNDGTTLHYTYDLAFVDTVNDGENRDYLALFKGLGSDFAVGIANITEGDGSTIFVGDEAALNLNVTNLTNDDLTFSFRYDVRDYYGNIIDAGLFIDNTVRKDDDANRKVTVKAGNYGMYYLNIYAITEKSSYIETYPFALLEDYDYRYNKTSPFGIAAMTKGGDQNLPIISARIAAKVGIANARGGKAGAETYEMIDLGITCFNGHYNPVNDSESKVENYVNNVMKSVDSNAHLIDSMEVGNEMSLEAQRAGGRPLEQLYPLFYNYTYQPTLKAIKEKYPHLEYIPTPFSACEQSWINMFSQGFRDDNGDGKADVGENGALLTNSENASWKNVEIVATHIYGDPWMPDTYGLYSPAYGAGMWHIESGMQRMKTMYDTHRGLRAGKADPKFYLTEVGYPTHRASSGAICPRTQADYTARIGAICAAYGCDRIQYYQLYDRISSVSGFEHTNKEFNFGLCYEQNYYGVVMPKPAIAAFAAMTRQLESMNLDTARISKEYDEGYNVGGVRAFEFDTALHGKVVVAYSNKQVLPNGRKNAAGATEDREPTLLWDSLWTQTDETLFYTDNETVKVVDTMGNAKYYEAANGKVRIPLTGEVVYIHGLK